MAYISRKIKEVGKKIKTKIISKLKFTYYNDIDFLPIYNYFKIQEGDLSFLYKNKYRNTFVPDFFAKIKEDLIFQFENLDLSFFNKYVNFILTNSAAVRTKNKNLEFHAKQLYNELINEIEKNKEKIKLNEFIDYIELSFESIGKINPNKMSTARAFSLYWRAVDKNKQTNKALKNGHNSK